ncbi:hypothetical protein BT96DRAFT_1020800 [Gymnopus androsaceus JB14]|uniref:Integral membrane protein n=1 Tax=Gymnopus androsaceus JB14 TaxID=1447944 RepID=A0A6A4HHD6_9AGAR|nr:hypothetical protein BT96DRAFT_1020800 [Gymnopus androsaceus JB14]
MFSIYIGTWSSTHALHIDILPPPLIIFLCLFSQFCIPAVQFSFFATIIALGIVQAMLIIRVWYLFLSQKFVQYGIMVLWAISMAVSLTYTGIAATHLDLLNGSNFALDSSGCRVARPVNFWRIFFPSLILHTILYVLTALRALRNRRVLKEAPVLKRLLRDGGLFFFVVFGEADHGCMPYLFLNCDTVSVGFTAVGSFLKDIPQINIPVIFSNYLIAVTSIAMSRIMFSIHSLASHLGSETGWLLSNVELRRIEWKKGATEGEIIVDCTPDSDDLESYGDEFRDGTLRSQSALKMSRVGMFNDDTMWSQ